MAWSLALFLLGCLQGARSSGLTAGQAELSVIRAGPSADFDGKAVKTPLGGRVCLAQTVGDAPASALSLKLLGQTLRYSVDLSQAGCGCKAVLRLQLPTQPESECGKRLCSKGSSCHEVVVQEANSLSWRSMWHAWHLLSESGAYAHTAGRYGPGADSCVDTSKPIQVAVDFPVDERGALASMDVTLSQAEQACTLSLHVTNYTDKAQISAALETGVTPLLSYEQDSKSSACSTAAGLCTGTVAFSGFSVNPIERSCPKKPRKACPGSVGVPGLGSVSLIGAAWNEPKDPAGCVEVANSSALLHMKGRAYFGGTCNSGGYRNAEYANVKLLKKLLRFKVDLSQTGCGCTATLYLTPLHRSEEVSKCGDHYCDANKVCGLSCAEIDVMEANTKAFYSSLHSAKDGNGVGGGYGAYRLDWNSTDYGPKARCIDTTRPFEVVASFPVGADGVLKAMEILLLQDTFACPLVTAVDRYRIKGHNVMEELTEVLRNGVTPILSYWGEGEDLTWLDGPGKNGTGPCGKHEKATCGSTVRFYDFAVEDIPEVGLPISSKDRASHSLPPFYLSDKGPPVVVPVMPPPKTTPAPTPQPTPPATFAPTTTPVPSRAPTTTEPPPLPTPAPSEPPSLPNWPVSEAPTPLPSFPLSEAPSEAPTPAPAASTTKGGTSTRSDEGSTKHARASATETSTSSPSSSTSSTSTKTETTTSATTSTATVTETSSSTTSVTTTSSTVETSTRTTFTTSTTTSYVPHPPWWIPPWARPAPTTTKPNGSETTVDPATVKRREYRFAGMANPQQARHLCGPFERLAMPKKGSEMVALQKAVQEEIKRGNMEEKFPYNTIWLGGHWRPDLRQWTWDDGEILRDWDEGRSTEVSKVQRQEPWLSLTGAKVRNRGRGYDFAVMCENTYKDPEESSAKPRHTQYTFVGYAPGPQHARHECVRHGKRLVKTKRAEEKEALMTFMGGLVEAGHMGHFWPNNTAWLAGRWSPIDKAWQWDDGDRAEKLDWAEGQPSAHGEQLREKWLCMSADGHYYDTAIGKPAFIFAVICEEDAIVNLVGESDLPTVAALSAPSALQALLLLATACVVGFGFLVATQRQQRRFRSTRALLHSGDSSESDASSRAPLADSWQPRRARITSISANE